MKAQQQQIEAILSGEGWAIIARESPTADWWLDEVWELASTWSPVNEKAFVGFLADPRASSERKPSEHVWAVVVSRQRPLCRDEARPEIPLGPRWESRKRSEFIHHVRGLRSEHSKEAG